jgi:hypothetical protein
VREDLLAEAAEWALVVARGAGPDEPPPPQLRPLLRFRPGLARSARSRVLRVLEEDDGFRSRVAAAVPEGDVGRAAWLFLTRPEGWQEELGHLVADAGQARQREEAEREERSARHRVGQLEDALEAARAERDAAVAERSAARRDLDVQRRRAHVAEQRAQQLERDLTRVERDRGEAVRQLTEARAAAERRLQDLREAEARAAAADAAGPDMRVWAAIEALRVAVGEAVEQLERSVRALGGVADRLDELMASAPSGAGAPAALGPAAAPPSAPGLRTPPAPPAAGRRRPHQLLRGATEDDPDGVEQLLRLDDVLVVVDGYNVSMRGWPDLDRPTQRDRLVAFLGDARARTGADIHVIFDGGDDGRRPAVSAPLPVRVHFSPPGMEADDVVLELVDGVPRDRPVVVVSDDRRVRDGGRRRGANVVGAEALLRWGR